MFIVYYILCAIVAFLFGIALAKSREPKCNHEWKLIEEFKINDVSNGTRKQIGVMKVYECEYCKKLKDERIKI